MKKLLLLLFLTSIITAQTNYYSTTKDLNSTQLKNELHNIIKGHVRFPYSSSQTDSWNILTKADLDPNNTQNVILIYTGESINGPAEYNSGSGWNREHVWAKSHGFSSSGDTAYTDCHNLHASNINANSARGNLDFDNGGNKYSNTGNYFDNDSWEPRDEIKGDVARTMLYMTVRYDSPSLDLELTESIPSSGKIFGKKSTLLEWNRLDPPSDFERRRNNIVYSYQKNRNPFIDHPEFADAIYSSSSLYLSEIESLNNSNFILTFSEDLDFSTTSDFTNYDLFNQSVLVSGIQSNYSNNANKILLSTNAPITDSILVIRVKNIKASSGKTIIENSLATVAVNPNAPLPVELSSFTATQNSKQIIFKWETATETNNHGFELEHKSIINSISNWKKIAFIQGNGTSTITNNYSFSILKSDLRIGENIFRLRQMDFDGTFTLSDELIISINPQKFALFQNYPNPFNPTTKISYQLPKDSFVNLEIFNSLGQKVSTLLNSQQTEGFHEIEYDASNLANGIYYYLLKAGNFFSTRKMMLIK